MSKGQDDASITNNKREVTKETSGISLSSDKNDGEASQDSPDPPPRKTDEESAESFMAPPKSSLPTQLNVGEIAEIGHPPTNSSTSKPKQELQDPLVSEELIDGEASDVQKTTASIHEASDTPRGLNNSDLTKDISAELNLRRSARKSQKGRARISSFNVDHPVEALAVSSPKPLQATALDTAIQPERQVGMEGTRRSKSKGILKRRSGANEKQVVSPVLLEQLAGNQQLESLMRDSLKKVTVQDPEQFGSRESAFNAETNEKICFSVLPMRKRTKPMQTYTVDEEENIPQTLGISQRNLPEMDHRETESKVENIVQPQSESNDPQSMLLEGNPVSSDVFYEVARDFVISEWQRPVSKSHYDSEKDSEPRPPSTQNVSVSCNKTELCNTRCLSLSACTTSAARATETKLAEAKSYLGRATKNIVSELAQDASRATKRVQEHLNDVKQSCLRTNPCPSCTSQGIIARAKVSSLAVPAVVALSFFECICTAGTLSYFYTPFKSTFLAFIGTAVANIVAMIVQMTHRRQPDSNGAMTFAALSVASMAMFCLYHAFKHPRHVGAIVPMNGLECLITAFATLGFGALFNFF